MNYQDALYVEDWIESQYQIEDDVLKEKFLSKHRRSFAPPESRLSKITESCSFHNEFHLKWKNSFKGWIINGMYILFGLIVLYLAYVEPRFTKGIGPKIGFFAIEILPVYFLYDLLAGIVNTSKFYLTKGLIRVKRGPLPYFGMRKFPLSRIKLFYVERYAAFPHTKNPLLKNYFHKIMIKTNDQHFVLEDRIPQREDAESVVHWLKVQTKIDIS